VFLDAARKRSNDPRFGFQHPDARALPSANGSFDRAFSMLALSFIPDIEHAVAEMRRVVRPGRTGDCSIIGPARRNGVFGCCGTPQPRSLQPPNGRSPVFVADRARRDERNVAPAGLVQVEQISLTTRVQRDFLCNRPQGQRSFAATTWARCSAVPSYSARRVAQYL
jgi:SAM-dependent methyltransferase